VNSISEFGHSGYLSANRLRSYPLADGQDVPMEYGKEQLLYGCIVDAMISIFDPDEIMLPRICNISSDGTTLRLSIAVGSEEVPLSVAWSSTRSTQYPIVSGPAPWGYYTMVFSSDGIRDLGRMEPIFPSSAPNDSSSAEEGFSGLYLAPRAVCRSPMGLRSIMVFDGVHPKSEGPHFIVGGDVAIKPGNNIKIEDPADRGDDINGMVVSAIPGAGAGRVASVKDTANTVVSQLRSEDGHVRIFNDTCYDIEPSTASAGALPGHIKIHAKCTACCTCDMYSSIVNDRLSTLFDMVKEARRTIGDLQDKYETHVEKFNRRISKPSADDIYVKLIGTAIGHNLSTKTPNIRGTLSRASFKCVVRNDFFEPVSITFVKNQASGGSTIEDTSLKTSGGISRHVDGALINNVFILGPGEYAIVNFVVFSNTWTSEAGGPAITASVEVTANFGGQRIGKYTETAVAKA